MTFKQTRIAVLLIVLLAAVGTTYYQRIAVANWDRPLSIEIYPINGDGSETTARYIASLNTGAFIDVTAFINDEGKRYGKKRMPLALVGLRREVRERPPLPPEAGSAIQVMWWSLRLRWWVFRQASSYAPTTARVFVLFHAPRANLALPHSLGLRKGLIGVVHAFADEGMAAQNNLVIAHEVLHTVGASDKYGRNNQPLFPHGYGNPGQEPLHPQSVAEIMAGRLAVGPDEARPADGLSHCVIGESTAREIGWLR